MKDTLTYKDALAALMYEPETGKLYWRVSRGAAKAGTEAGSVNRDGYVTVQIGCKRYRAHRLAWMLVNKEWPAPELVIDHIDGNTSNNKIENLRAVSGSLNQQNQAIAQRNNKCGLLGVSWHKKTKRWRAQIRLGKEKRHIGSYDTAEEAHAAYVAAKARLHEGFVHHRFAVDLKAEGL